MIQITKKITRNQLRQVDTVIDEFISKVSHELKTPTTAIQGFLWLVLQKDKQLSSYSREKIERVAKLTEQITALVNDMVDISKIDSKKISLHPESFDVRELGEEIKEELDFFAIQKSIKIALVNEGVYTIWADRQRVHQIVSNLVTNAIKYTKNGGRLKISFEKNDQLVTVHVADTGIGIAEEDMPKLFTKFGKVDKGNSISSHLPGSGLGLYITKNLVELSGGTIWVESMLTKGSTFSFSLPSKK